MHELAGLPWWTSAIVAIVVYVGIRWLLPALGNSNVFLRGLSEALHDKAWMFAAPFIVITVIAALNSRYRRRLFDAQIGVESLRVISWQDFEHLVGEAYQRQGYVIEEIGGSAPDGGIDLMLHRDGRKVVVQCKRWRSAQIGVTLVREFFGVIVAEKAERGILVTSGTFTPHAVEFARGKPIELVDGRALAALISGLQAGRPTPLPPSSPACPECGGEMARRLAKRGVNAGNEFWGCQRFPNCSGVRNIAAEGS